MILITNYQLRITNCGVASRREDEINDSELRSCGATGRRKEAITNSELRILEPRGGEMFCFGSGDMAVGSARTNNLPASPEMIWDFTQKDALL